MSPRLPKVPFDTRIVQKQETNPILKIDWYDTPRHDRNYRKNKDAASSKDQRIDIDIDTSISVGNVTSLDPGDIEDTQCASATTTTMPAAAAKPHRVLRPRQHQRQLLGLHQRVQPRR